MLMERVFAVHLQGGGVPDAPAAIRQDAACG